MSINIPSRRAPKPGDRAAVIVQFDGAIGTGNRAAGLGVVVRGGDGRIRQVVHRRVGPLTNNEAEYAALIWALELLVESPPDEVHFVSDSEIVVEQMRGYYSVDSPRLKVLHRRACELVRQLPRVTFTHVPREENGLADALAKEALWIKPPWLRRHATARARSQDTGNPAPARNRGR